MGISRTPYGTFVARWTDPYGCRTSRTFKTKADARAHLRRIYGDIARGDYTDTRRSRITLAVWADDWLEGARNLTRGGHDTYRRDLDRHILPVLGKVPVGKLQATDIDRYLTERGVLVAPSTVHRHYRTLHRMLAVAVERGLIARNPCEHVHPPRIPRTEMTVLDAAQVDALAAAITPRYRAWVYVMAYGGLRWAESVGLRRGHVNVSPNSLTPLPLYQACT
jgi:integrase